MKNIGGEDLFPVKNYDKRRFTVVEGHCYIVDAVFPFVQSVAVCQFVRQLYIERK